MVTGLVFECGCRGAYLRRPGLIGLPAVAQAKKKYILFLGAPPPDPHLVGLRPPWALGGPCMGAPSGPWMGPTGDICVFWEK